MTEARKAPGVWRRLAPNATILRWAAQLVLPLAGAGALLAGVVALGRHLGERGGVVLFRDLECDPPDGMTRQQFLEEAEYLSGVPNRLDGHDPLAQAEQGLTRHPWVLRVSRVQRLAGG